MVERRGVLMKRTMLLGIALSLIAIGSSFAVTDLSVQEVKAKIDSGEEMVILDVRESWEFEDGHIRGAIILPWISDVLQETYTLLPTDKPILVVCQSGRRSAAASAWLEEQGFDEVLDMVGGMNAWEYDIVTGVTGVGSWSWGRIKARRR